MRKSYSITKHNDLITAGYRLTLTEMQIILYGASLINPLNDEFPRTYQINIKHFARMFGREHNDVYSAVKEAVMNQFWEREFTFQDQYETDKEGNLVRIKMRWITTVKYSDKAGFIKIFFNPEIQPYLHNLKKNFTSYYIEQVSKFKRFYSVRFYEIAMMYLKKSASKKTTFKVSITDLKDILSIEDKYKRFCDLKLYVLEPSRKEINRHSDLTLNYDIIKQGRTPCEVKFTVTQRKETENNRLQHGDARPAQRLSPATLEEAKELTLKARTGWDLYAIEQEFYDFMKSKGDPNNLNKAFIGFVKKKIAKRP